MPSCSPIIPSRREWGVRVHPPHKLTCVKLGLRWPEVIVGLIVICSVRTKSIS